MFKSKVTRFISLALCVFLLFTFMPVEIIQAASGFTVNVGSVSGNVGTTIVVPVSFENVPSSGISTADMAIIYDASKLEYISGEAGSIVTNPGTNFAINKETNGKIKALFLDYTMSNGYISQNGVFLNLTFKVLSSGSTTVSVTGATFGDKSLSTVSPTLNAGKINDNGAVSTPVVPVNTPVIGSGFTVSVSSVSANVGETVTVPVSFANVPSSGISTADMAILYDASKLEYVSGTAGSIVTDPGTNFAINKESNGKLKALFLDYTMSTGYISQNGVFVNLTFKVIGSGSSTVSVTGATFGDKSLATVSAKINDGVVGSGGVVNTPVVNTPVVNTPVIPVNTPVIGSGFTVSVDSVTVNAGETVVVPVSFANVPSSGISTADMAILYDASKLEYVSGTAGSIVTDPGTNFAINKESNGKLKALFLDYTMSTGYISQNGVFIKLTFKAIGSGTSTVSVSGATFGDKSLASVTPKLNAGTITINGGGVVVPTSAVTPPPTTIPTPQSAGSFSVTYSDNSWGTGATVSLTIKNNGSSAVDGWNVSFTYSGDQKITNAWNCKYTQSGSTVTLTNEAYNASIPAGGSVTVGFNITYSGTNTAPTVFSVNSSSVGTNPTPVVNTPVVNTPVIPVNTPVIGSGFTVSVDSVSANVGETITVPVSFANVPSSGISTADMAILYDATKLEYVSGTAGSIVTDPGTNFAINKESNGKLKVLFLDYTMSNGYISQNGVFVNLTFKVIGSGSSLVSVDGATFGDKSLATVSAKLNAGTIGSGGVVNTPVVNTPVIPVNTPVIGSGFTVSVDSVSANVGETITVPVSFANVPSSGISTADMAILYDATKLEYVSGTAGSIVTDPGTNFAINKETNGKIKVLFLDYTMSNGYISQNGVFVNLTFKVLSSGSSLVSISGATFGDKSLSTVSAKLNAGTIGNGGAVSTPIIPVNTPTPGGDTGSNSGNVTVTYSDNSWGTGATVSLTIKNNGSTAIDGWTVSFDYSGDQKIQNAWNCKYTQSGSTVTLTNEGYNGNIPAGGSVSVGFNISYSGNNTAPTVFNVK